ncbi:MAG TPA: NAD(P)-dependent oxidoreductase [Pyrinomonadaceae bacterium]|nr:NAD(P)-dependent oxidoreductase [Pyrinomonadaceae bacterium]
MITVLGASGFIGSRIVKRLETLGREHRAVKRDDTLPAGSLGHVIYCIGLTADFRSRPLDTVEAHVCRLLEVLRACEFESLLYLSSTRLYSGAESTSEESAIRIAPLDGSDLYNASKAMGESLVLNCGRPARVIRISNVYGSDFDSNNFLSSIIRDAIRGEIVFQTSPDSAKDYIPVDNVVDNLINIATNGKERIYNLASGRNVSNGELAERLRRLTGCAIRFSEPAPLVTFPPINIDRLRAEFAFQPSHVLDDLPQLVDLYRRNLESSHDQS